MNRFYPEGRLLSTEENTAVINGRELMKMAAVQKTVLEARAVICTPSHDLVLDIPGTEAVIPRAEGALGIADGSTRDIAMLSRVGKPVCFTVMSVGEKDGLPANGR